MGDEQGAEVQPDEVTQDTEKETEVGDGARTYTHIKHTHNTHSLFSPVSYRLGERCTSRTETLPLILSLHLSLSLCLCPSCNRTSARCG